MSAMIPPTQGQQPPGQGVPQPQAPQAPQPGQVPPAQIGPDGQPLPPPDPANAPGVDTTYFALKQGGEDGKAVGLFRIAADDDAEVLTLERFTPDGEWEDDPSLIDELHEPGCYSVEEDEAQSIQTQILGHQPQQ